MNAKDAIKYSLNSNHQVLKMYLADLSDADLLARPAPGANHIAWQLGHLIASEAMHFLPNIPGGGTVELPDGFAAKHTKTTAASDNPADFYTKAQYLETFDKVRGAVLAAVEKMSDADLDRPNNGPMKDFAPTIGTLLLLDANHEMMHAGQFTTVRRKVGKPVLF
jgi:uncharacterized damage-inducible protein DinB